MTDVVLPRPPVARPRQAVILAGGRGSRLRPLTDTRPKPMVEFAGKPFLQHTIELLRDQGFERFLLLLGYLPEVVVDHFGDGSRLGVRIDYVTTAPDDLTARRVQAAGHLLDDWFMLLYCDNYWPLRADRMWEELRASGAAAMVTVYANRDRFSRDSVIVDDGRVRVFDRARTTPGLGGVEISYAYLPRQVVDLLPAHQELFEQAVYPELARRGELAAHWAEHRYYSVGSLERLQITEAFFRRQPTVLLDRDGVLNRKMPRGEYVTEPDAFEWLPGALAALRRFRESGWRVVVVSNQAGLARGALDQADLDQIHKRMTTEAEDAGGAIEAIYVCPHHWDEGCFCRKPSPGMLLAAQRDYHLDLSRTPFVGDDERDGQAADAAGCPFEPVTDDRSLLDVTDSLLQGR
ncbi:MAG: HAD-IIIA family hydrolase [Egibacteraceae bacterium]